MQTETVPTVAPVAVTQNPHQGTRQGYNASMSKCLGGTQIAIGGSCFIFQIVAIAIHAGLYFVGHGIWCGIFFIIAGVFGIAAGNTKRTGYIITFMTLSILAATLVMCPLIACASIGVILDSYPYYGRYPYFNQDDPKKWMNGLMIGLAILEGIIAIISSAICCGPLCSPASTTGTVYTQGQLQYNPTTGQQVVVVTMPPGRQPQYVMASGVTPQYVMQPTVYTIQSGLPANTSIPPAVPTNPPAYSPQGTSDQAQVHTSCSAQPPPYNPQMAAHAYDNQPPASKY